MASYITSDDRTRLLPENAEKLFLKYNLRAIGYKSFHLPTCPKGVSQGNADPAEIESNCGEVDALVIIDYD